MRPARSGYVRVCFHQNGRQSCSEVPTVGARAVAAANAVVHAMENCQTQLAALHECKRGLGLHPRQCYPQSGYRGECDANEFALKRCLAYAANPRDAAVLYDAKAPRKDRVDANARLQKKLRRFNEPCTP